MAWHGMAWQDVADMIMIDCGGGSWELGPDAIMTGYESALTSRQPELAGI